MSEDSLYRVDHSAEVAEQFLKLSEQAQASGRRTAFLRAARWIMEELASTPHEFGESRERYEALRLTRRCGIVRPLFVDYAIHDEHRIVFIRRFALLK